MALASDSEGFLKGRPLDLGRTLDPLRALRADIAGIKEMLRKGLAAATPDAPQERPAAPAPPERAAPPVVVQPLGKSGDSAAGLTRALEAVAALAARQAPESPAWQAQGATPTEAPARPVGAGVAPQTPAQPIPLGDPKATGLLAKIERGIGAQKSTLEKGLGALKDAIEDLTDATRWAKKDDGGGLLGKLPGLLGKGAKLAKGALGKAGGAAKGLLKGAGGLLKKLPIKAAGPAAALMAAIGLAQDFDAADADPTLTDRGRKVAKGKAVGKFGGTMAGSAAGAMAGAVLGPVGMLAGGLIGGAIGAWGGGKAGEAATDLVLDPEAPGAVAGPAGGAADPGVTPEGRTQAQRRASRSEHTAPVSVDGWQIGQTSKRYESGKGGAGTVSSGKGDPGGVSYGTYQLATTKGSPQKFVAQSKYKEQFAGLKAGTPEFSAKWKEIAATDPTFGAEQHDFIKRNYYDQQMGKLKKGGVDLSQRGPAVHDAVWSTSVQMGPNTGVVQNALKGKDVAAMSDAEVVTAIQDYKVANNDKLFSKAPADTKAKMIKRAHAEKKSLVELAQASPTAVGAPAPTAQASAAQPSSIAPAQQPAGAPPVAATAPATAQSEPPAALAPGQPAQPAPEQAQAAPAVPAPEQPAQPAPAAPAPGQVTKSVIRRANQGATRNKDITPVLESRVHEAVRAVYGDGASAELYSGGQDAKGKGTRRTGSTRHDDGKAGDFYIKDAQGKQIKGDDLGKIGQYWTAKGYGGVGMEMRGGGIHLDQHTDRATSWGYEEHGGRFSKAQRAAVARGKRGELPELKMDPALAALPGAPPGASGIIAIGEPGGTPARPTVASSAPGAPSVPGAPALPSVAAAPAVTEGVSGHLGGGSMDYGGRKDNNTPVVGGIGQDVRDRRVAHIVTGGIGAAL